MSSDEQFEDLLIRFEELAKWDPTSSVDELTDRDTLLASEIQRDPKILARLQTELASLREINRQMGLDIAEDPIPEIPGFTDLREIGRGGMGVVYCARQTAVNRHVAIKLMLAGRLGGATLRKRFHVEAEAVARLRHPNIVELHEIGEFDRVPYACFEYLAGESLTETVARETLGMRQAARTVETIARAVEYAHQQGIIHRDLKPSNIRASEAGILKITDFGIAKKLNDEDVLTQTGEAPGSPSYMAPEQLENKDVGPAVDIYALGAILYELLTGRPPFLGETSAETMVQLSTQDPLPPSVVRGAVPADLEAVCLKCLEKSPSRRYASAEELADDLRRWLDGKVTSARPAGPVTRFAKFVRRRPTLASLIVFLSLAFVALGFAGWWHSLEMRRSYLREYAARDMAERNQELATANAEEAISAKRKSDQLLYYAMLHRAHEAWKSDLMASFHIIHDDMKALELSADRNEFPHRYLERLASLADVTLQSDSPHLFSSIFVDDQTLATGDQAGVMKLWDRATGELLQTIPAHSSCINSIDLSPDARLLATGSCDETIHIWRLSDMSLQRRLRSSRGPVGTVRFQQDAKTLVSYGIDHALSVWDLQSETLGQVLPPEPNQSHTVANSAGDWIATAHAGGHLRWWPQSDPTAVKSQTVNTSIEALLFNHAGTHLAAIGQDSRIWIWNVNDTDVGSPFRGFSAGRVAAFSEDDKLFALASADLVIRAWEVPTRRLMVKLKGFRTPVTDMSFDATNSELFAVTDGGEAKLWRLDDVSQFNHVEADTDASPVASLSPDACWMAVGRKDGAISIKQLPANSSIDLTGPRTAPLRGITFSPDGRLLIANWIDGLNRFWDLSHGSPVLFRDLSGKSPMALSGSKRIQAVQGESAKELLISSLENDGQTRRFNSPSDVLFCEFDLTGESLVIGTKAGSYLWDLAAKNPTPLVSQQGGWPRHCKFSPDGRFLAVVFDHHATVYDRTDLSVKSLLHGHALPITAIAFAPNGNSIATGCSDGTIRIWHTATGQEALRLDGHTHSIGALEFVSRGDALYSIGISNGQVRDVLCWPTD